MNDDNPLADIERENVQAERERNQREDDESEPESESTEEDLAIAALDQEHYEDYRAIRQAIEHTDLAENVVMTAVKFGLQARGVPTTHEVPF